MMRTKMLLTSGEREAEEGKAKGRQSANFAYQGYELTDLSPAPSVVSTHAINAYLHIFFMLYILTVPFKRVLDLTDDQNDHKNM